MDNVLARKLELFGELPPSDRELLDEIVSAPRQVEADTDLIREGERPNHVHVVIQGLACRYQMLEDGKRQITAFLLPGDFCDLHVFILKAMDHNIATLTESSVAIVPRTKVLELTERPALARALWWATLVDEATLRATVVNIGRREAEERVAHLFCELHLRLQAVGLADGGTFELPLTQAELADAMGISAVHANRMLQSLRQRHLIRVSTKSVTILDVPRLRELSGFDPNYLHLGGGQPGT